MSNINNSGIQSLTSLKIMTANAVTTTSLSPNQNICSETGYYLDMWSNATIIYQDQSVVMLFDFVVFGIIMSVISSIGLLGNSVIIYILSITSELKSVSPYLICLAVSDNLYIVFNHFFNCIFFGLKNVMDLTNYCSARPYQIYAPHFMLAAFVSSSTMTATITIVRYIAISRPLKAKVWFTNTINKRIAIIVTLVSIIPCLFTFFPNEVFECFRADGTLLMKLVRLKESQAWVKANTIVNIIIGLQTSFVPWFLLLVFNALLLMKLKEAKNRRSNLAVASQDKKRSTPVTVLLVCMTMSFVILIFPLNCFVIMEFIKRGKLKLNICDSSLEVDTMRMLYAFTSLGTFNSCINFFWLVTLSTEFRTKFLKLIRWQTISAPGDRMD